MCANCFSFCGLCFRILYWDFAPWIPLSRWPPNEIHGTSTGYHTALSWWQSEAAKICEVLPAHRPEWKNEVMMDDESEEGRVVESWLDVCDASTSLEEGEEDWLAQAWCSETRSLIYDFQRGAGWTASKTDNKGNRNTARRLEKDWYAKWPWEPSVSESSL